MIIIKSGAELEPMIAFILLGISIAILIYAIWLIISVFKEM